MLAAFLYKGPDSKQSRFCGPGAFCLWSEKAAIDIMYMNGYNSVPTECYLQNQVVG